MKCKKLILPFGAVLLSVCSISGHANEDNRRAQPRSRASFHTAVFQYPGKDGKTAMLARITMNGTDLNMTIRSERWACGLNKAIKSFETKSFEERPGLSAAIMKECSYSREEGTYTINSKDILLTNKGIAQIITSTQKFSIEGDDCNYLGGSSHLLRYGTLSSPAKFPANSSEHLMAICSAN
jgi:hypothetical protein